MTRECRPWAVRIIIGPLFSGLVLMGLQGCAGDAGLSTGTVSVPAVTSYKQANMVEPQGFSVSQIDEQTVRVTATGSASTPNERLVKIAMARAAQYGAEERKKSFRAGEPVYATQCGKTHVVERGTRRAVQPSDYRTVSLDVTYGPGAGEAGDRPTKDTAGDLVAQLQSDTVPADIQMAAAAELAQICGR